MTPLTSPGSLIESSTVGPLYYRRTLHSIHNPQYPLNITLMAPSRADKPVRRQLEFSHPALVGVLYQPTYQKVHICTHQPQKAAISCDLSWGN